MVRKTNKHWFHQGVTLVEVMCAIVILTVAVLGSSGYRYYSTLDARKADMRIAASRIGLLLCEGWRGVKGTNTYDPTSYSGSGLAITAVGNETVSFTPGAVNYYYFTQLGNYRVVSAGNDYYAVLSWKDVDTGLRALNVVVLWSLSEKGEGTFANAGRLRSLDLTTYTEN